MKSFFRSFKFFLFGSAIHSGHGLKRIGVMSMYKLEREYEDEDDGLGIYSAPLEVMMYLLNGSEFLKQRERMKIIKELQGAHVQGLRSLGKGL